MRRRHWSLLCLPLGLISASLALRFTSHPPYRCLDLGTLGGRWSLATALNNRGQVVGQSHTASGQSHAFLWQAGKMQDLGTLGGMWSIANGINNRGEVVGSSDLASGQVHAFLWRAGKMTDLGTLGGTSSVAYGINDRGQVVGLVKWTDAHFHAFLWQEGRMQDLGTFGGANSLALAINNRGQIVGRTHRHAVLWQDGRMQGLGTLGGLLSQADALNDQGVAVGSANTDAQDRKAFCYRPDGMQAVEAPDNIESLALGINDRGQIVGMITPPVSSEGSAYAWLQQGRQKGDLNALAEVRGGWHLDRASGINNRGEIACTASRRGDTHAMLVRPR